MSLHQNTDKNEENVVLINDNTDDFEKSCDSDVTIEGGCGW